MSLNIAAALYNRLAFDSTLTAMLAHYKHSPAIFTTSPVPGDASAPYIVVVGRAVSAPFDTKLSIGLDMVVDIKAYSAASGSADRVNDIAERVRTLLHRQSLSVGGYNWVLSSVSGPIVADEIDYYSRLVSLSIKLQEQ